MRTSRTVNEDTINSSHWWEALWHTCAQLDFCTNTIFLRIIQRSDRTNVWTTWKQLYKDVKERTFLSMLLVAVQQAPFTLIHVDWQHSLLEPARRQQLADLATAVELSSVLHSSNVVLGDAARCFAQLTTLLNDRRMLDATRCTYALLAAERTNTNCALRQSSLPESCSSSAAIRRYGSAGYTVNQLPIPRSQFFEIGGPKILHYIKLGEMPVVLLGERHHKRSDGMTVIHFIKQLMESCLHARLLVETPKFARSRSTTATRNDKVSKQVDRTALTYPNRSWAVALKKIYRNFCNHIFDAANPTVAPTNNKKILRRYRRKLARVLLYVYSGGVDGSHEQARLDTMANEMFPHVPHAINYLTNCVNKFNAIANRRKGNIRAALDIYVKEGMVVPGISRPWWSGSSNSVQTDSFAGAMVFFACLVDDIYSCDIVASNKSPAIFYGGATHCAQMRHILMTCYAPSTVGSPVFTCDHHTHDATAVQLSEFQHGRILLDFALA
jgi:hypothetical protein